MKKYLQNVWQAKFLIFLMITQVVFVKFSYLLVIFSTANLLFLLSSCLFHCQHCQVENHRKLLSWAQYKTPASSEKLKYKNKTPASSEKLKYKTQDSYAKNIYKISDSSEKLKFKTQDSFAKNI